jgi:predicted nucleic acid-binding protein
VSDAIVIDASVALAWALGEQYRVHAWRLIDDALAEQRPIVVPPVFHAEATNAIFQRHRRDELSAAEATQALNQILAQDVRIVTSLDLYRDALALAQRFKLSAAYDSQYLAATVMIDGQFWTADARLLRALPRSFKRAQWIGDYPLGA